MELEFEIGETDYNLVWTMKNNVETADKAEDIMEENVECRKCGSILQVAANKENTNKVKPEKSEEEGGTDMGQYSDPKQDQETIEFRESWGLPPAAPENENQDEEDMKHMIKVIKAKMEKDNQEDIKNEDNPENQDEEDMKHIFKEEPTKDVTKDQERDDSTEANFDANSDYQNMAFPTQDNPETKEFNLKIGAGSRSIKLSRKSSGSSPPVFSKLSEGFLEEEDEEDFGKAWLGAVFGCRLKRMAAGHTADEVLAGLVEEMGLIKFMEIVEHFLGSLTIEQVEDNADMNE